MRTFFYRRLFALVLLVAGALPVASAAIVTTHYTNLAGSLWSVDLALTNDVDAAGINEFTVYFAPSMFAALTVQGTPAGWDSFVAQPDAALAAPGFFDSFRAQALPLGSMQAGFQVGFTFLGQGTPGQLAFDIVGPDFVATSSGMTVALQQPSAPVPEPSAALLMLTAGMLVGVSRKARQTHQARKARMAGQVRLAGAA